MDFLDTLAGYGKKLGGSVALGAKNTADAVVDGASEILSLPGFGIGGKTGASGTGASTGASNGVVKQPPKGKTAAGATVVPVPANTTINNTTGKLEQTQQSADLMKIGGALLLGAVVLVVVVKVLK